jgi:hypothetical protein
MESGNWRPQWTAHYKDGVLERSRVIHRHDKVEENMFGTWMALGRADRYCRKESLRHRLGPMRRRITPYIILAVSRVLGSRGT